MAFTKWAQKLLSWFNIYKVTPLNYAKHIKGREKRGLFKFSLAELVFNYDYLGNHKPLPDLDKV